MKIPQVFILEKPLENKLENLLQVKTKTMIKKVSDYKYECYCNICGDLAGSLETVFGKFSKPNHNRIDCWPRFELEERIYYKEPELIIKNFYGIVAVPKDEEFLESVTLDLDKNDLKSVFKKLDGNYLTFYDLDEDKCYCWDHFKDYLDKKISSLR